MRFAVPVAQYHRGNPGEYVVRSLKRLGHDAEVLTVPEFYASFSRRAHDFYFCIDSGAPLDLTRREIANLDFGNVCFWFIDYRMNKHRPGRVPDDFTNASSLHQRGGWVFQAQYPDF